MARIGIIGSEGRMGQAIAAVLDASDDHTLAGGIDNGGDVAELAGQSDALVDFSAPCALQANLTAAKSAGIPILIGTTGLEASHHGAIDAAAQDIPVLQTGNTSLGVTLLAHLVQEAASRLGPDWDIEIVEMHHRMKVDAPSRHRASSGRSGSGRSGHRSRRAHGKRARRPYRSKGRGRDRVRRPARRHGGGRPLGYSRRRAGAADPVASGGRPEHLRTRRGSWMHMADWTGTGSLFDAPGAWSGLNDQSEGNIHGIRSASSNTGLYRFAG